jgi:hypothetical protein
LALLLELLGEAADVLAVFFGVDWLCFVGFQWVMLYFRFHNSHS